MPTWPHPDNIKPSSTAAKGCLELCQPMKLLRVAGNTGLRGGEFFVVDV